MASTKVEAMLEWGRKYEDRFGRPYPPFFMDCEDRTEDIKRCIMENDPYPPECNDSTRWY